MEYKYSYSFTEKAVNDLESILKYISVDLLNPKAAQNLGRSLFRKIDYLRLFPESGIPVNNIFV